MVMGGFKIARGLTQVAESQSTPTVEMAPLMWAIEFSRYVLPQFDGALNVIGGMI